MTQETAVQLIRQGVAQPDGPQTWADLGCGRGVFTIALASILQSGSTVHAVDRDENEMKFIATSSGGSTINTICMDFAKDPIPLNSLDGVLMGNALHYVKEPVPFLNRLRNHILPHGCLLVVEYEVTKPNPWIPYPVPFRSLESIGLQAGFSSCTRLDSVPSQLREAQLYSAILSQLAQNR